MYTLRPYQQAAVDAVYCHLREKEDNPCVVIPTAGGKSLCLAQVARDVAFRWHRRVLILAHVKELVEQNADKLNSLCPELKLGVYSAGLERRDTKESVIVAGIQSVYNKATVMGAFDLVMVDEVHMVPPDGEGRYRTFLSAAKELNPRIRLVGWTATPFRTHGGLICKPENLFNSICYEVGIRDLIDDGFISKVTSKCGRAQADLDRLHIRGGEFVQEDVEKAMGVDRVVDSACREIVEKTRTRKTCLIFCTSVKHCHRVATLITKYSGEECAVVTGETPPLERARIIARLRGEQIDTDLFGVAAPPLRYCCNVAVMTTGTDIPGIDTVALLRPTNSPGLLIQMIGRGFRLSPATGKTECLVLDYGKNIERFGPIDAINIKDPSRAEKGEAFVKTCPKCQRHVHLSQMMCPECGYQFPAREKVKHGHEGSAAQMGILTGEVTDHQVVRTEYRLWTKRNAPADAPRTVRVTYYIDLYNGYSEWLCPEHSGYARMKFERWWREHTVEGCPPARTAQEVLEYEFMGMIRKVTRISVRQVAGERFPQIVGYELGGLPNEEEALHEEEEEDFEDLPF